MVRDQPPPRQLAPSAPRPPAWRRFLARARRVPWVTLALAVALAAKFAVCETSERERDCRQTARVATDAVTVLVCQEEYARASDPQVGALLANALRRSSDLRGASAVANSLLSTPARADALVVLGKIALTEKRYHEAQRLLELAADLHSRSLQHRAEGRDWLALGNVFYIRQDLLASLQAVDRAIHGARKSGDREGEILSHVSASRAFSTLGHFPAAIAEVERALSISETVKERAWSIYESGNVQQEFGNFHQGAVHIERALALATEAQLGSLILSLHLELADCLTETGELEGAAHHLEAAKVIDTTGRLMAERIALEGRLAARRGQAEQAERLLEQSLSITDPEELTEVNDLTISLARLALQRGDFARAEKWARRATTSVRKLQEKNSPPLFRSLLLARYRTAHELLLLALARAGRADAALLALDDWQQQAAFVSLVPEATASASITLRDAASEVATIDRLQTALAQRRRDEVKSSVSFPAELARGASLALLVLEGELWRISVHSGATHLTRLGRMADLSRQFFDRLRVEPLNLELTSAIGRLLVPLELAVRTSRPLQLWLDDALVPLPIEALRINGAPLVSLRPLVRVRRPLTTSCVALPAAKRATVIADAQGDLPAARGEATRAAARFASQSKHGADATKAALWSADATDLLHVAVHGEASEEGGALLLHDGPVKSLDIATHGRAPPRVLLTTCVSAIAPGGHYSLATAYLAAGAHQVIATLRPISDEGAALISTRLYEAGAALDPVRALAKVQAELAATDNQDWPYFAAFGRETCSDLPGTRGP
ncbi:MAG TPA: CHAT domain-containing protein [Kofleriaceae bacterium]|nr:CHAT domain-containing protein [Kofleriaceae bacterium]